jgi:hypothetical protein
MFEPNIVAVPDPGTVQTVEEAAPEVLVSSKKSKSKKVAAAV